MWETIPGRRNSELIHGGRKLPGRKGMTSISTWLDQICRPGRGKRWAGEMGGSSQIVRVFVCLVKWDLRE